ncbi:MAG: hypothetical protein IJ678_04145 [Kiritimatiellae bacterium]|nr:hypothetical protein [Kiritimatiellia bacterium]MBR1836555.1 hypothetical protein [Kiritimatiellia bacterium]
MKTIAPFLAALLLFEAPAMLREADNLPYENPVRVPAMRLLAPVSRLSAALFLDRPRAWAEAVRKAAEDLAANRRG